MGCTLDHSPVAFSTSRRYTECVFLIKGILHGHALQTFRRRNMKGTSLKYTLYQSLILHAILSTLCWAWMRTLYSRYQVFIKYLSHKQQLQISKENWRIHKLFFFFFFLLTWAFRQTDTPVTWMNTFKHACTHRNTHTPPGYGRQRQESSLQPLNTCHCLSPVCPPETDYFDQSAKWLDQLGALEWASTAACCSLKTCGTQPIRTASLGSLDSTQHLTTKTRIAGWRRGRQRGAERESEREKTKRKD